MNHSRLSHIDAWRFIAIAIVIMCHVVAYSHPWYRELAPALVWRFQAMGTIGVQVFFCISGYVICLGMIREKERYGNISLRSFYIRRAYRIMPPLLLYILALVLLTQLHVLDVPGVQFLQAAAFLCNIKSLPQCVWPLGHTWSLAYEEQFYLVFPLLFIWLALSNFRWRIGIVILLLGIGACIAFATGNKNFSMSTEHFLCMVAGCTCGLYWNQLNGLFSRMPVVVWLLSLAGISATCLFVVPAAIRYSVIPFLIPVLICIAVLGTPLRIVWIRRFFENKWLAYIRQISYSVYLWQQLATDDYGFSSPLVALLLLLGVFIFAHFSFQLFEMKMIGFGAVSAARAAPEKGLPVVSIIRT